MRERIIDCGNGFWNIRGSFKIGGLIQIGTQASLVRLGDGRFVMLDSYTLSPDLLAEVDAITGGREKITAVLNLHPFHTLHSEAMHRDFPDAAHFGTPRHLRLFPKLTWGALTTDDPILWERFAPDLEFSTPEGVELIPDNERIHCGSILAYHRPSRTIHVDDTFNYRPPKSEGKSGKLGVHPTLSMALEKRAGAAQAFRDWGAGLVARWEDAERLCAAHSGVLSPERLGADSMRGALVSALAGAEKKLDRHARKHG
ncbi:hypothetical protein [Maritimibacter sp. UBA3975]|uniref:hypothetical protein n=1 Tax=Maritimibacter sp. UBA3975 TaxID=1946833 RepID=UPI000C08DC40|nr:hypothetical protein [Maritimibacter sp. UBA3975]MAM60236.1 hypothetical protein [Maritimibacter sp.]|tara:strand:+ start:6385 stop:7155 length:771 start_codon:yes stop_codon:yes gene_type:complete